MWLFASYRVPKRSIRFPRISQVITVILCGTSRYTYYMINNFHVRHQLTYKGNLLIFNQVKHVEGSVHTNSTSENLDDLVLLMAILTPMGSKQNRFTLYIPI
jgi:hypothetical protein